MIVEQGDESYEVEPLSYEDIPVEGFYGVESSVSADFGLTRFSYEGGGENIEAFGDTSPFEKPPENTFALTTVNLKPEGEVGEDELPVSLNTQYAESFRILDRASTPTGVEEGEDTSKLFFYEDSEGVSLVVIHDYHESPEDGTGGKATFEFDGLPDGEWAVQDSVGDFRRTGTDGVVNWIWDSYNTDGGAYRFEADEFSFTLTPEFESGISDWELLSGDAEEPERIDLTLDEPITLRGGEPDTVSASATTISFVPGRDETIENNNSAFPDEGNSVSVPFVPEPQIIKPDGFYGDGIDSGDLPITLEDALDVRKTVDEAEVSGQFKAYRLKNTLNLSYSVTDDGRVDTTEPISVGVNTEDPVNQNLISQPYTTEVSTADEELPPTVVHDEHYFGTGSDLDLLPFVGVSDSQSSPPSMNDRYLNVTKANLNNTLEENVQGIRVSTIWGAANSYIQDLVNLIGEEGEAPRPFPDNPHVYTWVEIALLTDGTVFVRVPDASIFPRHVLYVNKLKSDTNGFTVSEDASDDGYSARYNENSNNVWEAFRRETEGGIVVPYRTPHNSYINEYNTSDNPDNFPGHPVMVHGVNKDGDVISDEEVEDILGEPLDPFPTGELN